MLSKGNQSATADEWQSLSGSRAFLFPLLQTDQQQVFLGGGGGLPWEGVLIVPWHCGTSPGSVPGRGEEAGQNTSSPMAHQQLPSAPRSPPVTMAGVAILIQQENQGSEKKSEFTKVT